MIGKNKKILSGVIIAVCLFMGSALLINVDSEAIDGNDQEIMSSRQSSNLTFWISMPKTTFIVGEPINVTCTLTNTGNTSINVSELDPGFMTIDFNISTPNGYNIHLIGYVYDTPPAGIILTPQTSINYTIDLTDPYKIFSTGSPSDRFDFTPTGSYTIQETYTSDPMYSHDQTVWNGTLFSNALSFQITNTSKSTNLSFRISMAKTTLTVGEPINVTCTLRNIGNMSINVSELDPGLFTIDYNISTPSGYNIHYIYPVYDHPSNGVVLTPKTSINYTIDLTDPYVAFNADTEPDRFYFTTIGRYTIQAIYTSNPMHSSDQTVWDGTLFSNTLSFQILNTSKILINELYFNTNLNLQWVELYNPSSNSIDINGWIIDCYLPIYVTKITQEAIIGPNQFIIICNDQNKLTTKWNVSEAIIIVDELWMLGGSGEISLRNSFGVIDYVNYDGPPSGAPKVPVNHSVARYKGGYDTDNSSQDFYNESTPTPGRENTRSKYEEPEAILEFKSSLNKHKYLVGEPIYITSTLTNKGNTTVNMNKFSLELNTIDFYISTPEGYDISFKPSVFGEDILVKLDPRGSINYTVDIRDPVWNFGNLDGIDNYNFTTIGNYTIRSVYTSALFSDLLYFEIIDNTSNNGGKGSGSSDGNGDSNGEGWVKITTTYAPGLAIVAICIIISISIVAGTEVGKYGFFAAVSPLYTRLDRDDVVQQENRWQIIGFIKGKPGTTYGEIKRKLDIGNGTLAYHLKVLEREEFIKSKNRGRFKCFYAIEERVPHEEVKLSNIQKQILDTVRANPGISQKKIIIVSGKTQQVISYHLGILIRENLITKKKKGRVMIYFAEEDSNIENN